VSYGTPQGKSVDKCGSFLSSRMGWLRLWATPTHWSAQVACGLHGLQRVQTARNLRSRGFRQAIEWGYMRSRGSIPSIVRPEASTRLVAEHSASRESRTAPEDCSTGHCS
jgi:hypothetical protein